MFSFLKKRQKCDHDWHKTVERTEDIYHYNGINADIESNTFTYIYCPKCRTRKKINHKEWEILCKEIEILRDYERNESELAD